MTLAKMASNFSFSMGRFTLPHAISSCTAGVSTMNLSLALRPVYFPVFTTSAPVADRVPSPRRRACSVELGRGQVAIYRRRVDDAQLLQIRRFP